MLQNGKLPRFIPEDLLQEIFTSVNPSPCMLAIRKGLRELGVYQVGCLQQFYIVFFFNIVFLNTTQSFQIV